jgi:hypothetical protein
MHASKESRQTRDDREPDGSVTLVGSAMRLVSWGIAGPANVEAMVELSRYHDQDLQNRSS